MRLVFKHLVLIAVTSVVSDSVARTLSTTVLGALNETTPDSSISDVAKNTAAKVVSDEIESQINENLSNTEVSIDVSPDGDNTIGILSVQPLTDPEDVRNTVFGQGSLFSSDGRHTVNLGLGYRHLSEDHKWIYGVNTFYDHELPYDHSRASVGLEVLSSIFQFRANEYHALSGWRTGKDSIEEHALDGRDLEVSLAIPYMPASRIYHQRFEWDALTASKDLEGQTTSVEVSGDIFTPGLTFSLGRTEFDGERDNLTFLRIDYRIGGSRDSHTPLFSSQPFNYESMKDARLQKVRRQNRIVKQTKTRVIFKGN